MATPPPERQTKVRVLIVDDHPIFRRGLADWINHQPDLTCCAEAESVAVARQTMAQCQPDLVLLDLRLKDGDGLDLLRELCEFHPGLRVIVLSQMDEEVYACRALRAGARGYVMKSEIADVVGEAIRTVLGGDVHVSSVIRARLPSLLFPDARSGRSGLQGLSDRELQVFQLLGAGLGTRQIAELLGISPKTVEAHREHLKQKLHLPDAQALYQASRKWVETSRL